MAARILARAPRSESEITQRLVAMGYQPATAARTVACCRERGWVNDRALALDRARALRSRGAGSLRIGAELEGRGVAASLVAQAVGASREGENETTWARRALARLGPLRDAKARARAWRRLATQGFPEEIVAELLSEPWAGDPG